MRRMLVTLVVVVLAFTVHAASPARTAAQGRGASPPRPAVAETKQHVDVDMLLGQRYFERGLRFYTANDYVHALDAFEVAQRFKPAPALSYNTGRCHDRLEQVAAAIADYERYLADAPQTPDAASVRARVKELRARLADQPARTPGAKN